MPHPCCQTPPPVLPSQASQASQAHCARQDSMCGEVCVERCVERCVLRGVWRGLCGEEGSPGAHPRARLALPSPAHRPVPRCPGPSPSHTCSATSAPHTLTRNSQPPELACKRQRAEPHVDRVEEIGVSEQQQVVNVFHRCLHVQRRGAGAPRRTKSKRQQRWPPKEVQRRLVDSLRDAWWGPGFGCTFVDAWRLGACALRCVESERWQRRPPKDVQPPP
eukprot:127980-Chlamydomonas_euryale.AAC.3